MVNEAYARQCYEDIVQAILTIFKKKRKHRKQEGARAMLFIIRGSSGIGKSTFLGYFVVRMKNIFVNIAICYASKNAKSATGTKFNVLFSSRARRSWREGMPMLPGN